jgi:hypothetical protein
VVYSTRSRLPEGALERSKVAEIILPDPFVDPNIAGTPAPVNSTADMGMVRPFMVMATGPELSA